VLRLQTDIAIPDSQKAFLCVIEKEKMREDVVVDTCNLSYLGGKGRRIVVCGQPKQT
jgi:hypothetical protein